MSTNNLETLATIKNFNLRVNALEVMMRADKHMPQPWCYTQYFDDVKDQSDPMGAAALIAQVFKDVYGLIVIEAEGSYCSGNGKVLTIMDEFDHPESKDGAPVSQWLLERAFKEAGFKRGDELDQKVLMTMYHAAGYTDFRNDE
jgi:hypothetical protein